jgi:hypothetical protein
MANGDKTFYQQVSSDEKEYLTVLMIGNADGVLAPPVVVFIYNRVPQDIARCMPPK